MNKFNDNIQIVNNNNQNLEEVISQTDKNKYKVHPEELYSIINYITIRITDKDNSLEMCRLGIPHSCIIRQTDLNTQKYISKLFG